MISDVISRKDKEYYKKEMYGINEQQPNIYSSFNNIENLDLSISYK
jgi:hypothetical protein